MNSEAYNELNKTISDMLSRNYRNACVILALVAIFSKYHPCPKPLSYNGVTNMLNISGNES